MPGFLWRCFLWYGPVGTENLRVEVGGNIFIINFPKYVSERIGSRGVARWVLYQCGVIFGCSFPGGLTSKRHPRFPRYPCWVLCGRCTQSDMLLYFGCHHPSNVTEKLCFLQLPRLKLKVAGTFLKWLQQWLAPPPLQSQYSITV